MRPREFYHLTDVWSAETILKEGLKPRSETGAQVGWGWEGHGDELRSRGDHVYLARDDDALWDKALEDPDYVILAIDPSYLDPQRVDADEDLYMSMVAPEGVPEYHEWVKEQDPYSLNTSWGDWADTYSEQLDAPNQTALSLGYQGSIAYRGAIPPEAISMYADRAKIDGDIEERNEQARAWLGSKSAPATMEGDDHADSEVRQGRPDRSAGLDWVLASPLHEVRDEAGPSVLQSALPARDQNRSD